MLQQINELILKSQENNDGLDELFLAIKERVAKMLDDQPDLLFSYMYRLDIDEKDLKSVINNKSESDMASGFAELILSRQLKRIQTRREGQNVSKK